MVTVSLELSDADASRPFIEAAKPDHPSLLDPTHRLDELFGVVNIPNVVWIDEGGMIVRPPEPGWPRPSEYPESLQQILAERAKAAAEDPDRRGKPGFMELLMSGQDVASYADAIRDWARNGADSVWAMSPEEVIAASQPRPVDKSAAAAHFALATHLWHAGARDAAIEHFNACHRLQPDNWTYKRQAWSLIGNERVGGGELGRFAQGPLPGEEADWPFDSNFDADVQELGLGEYYPKTM